jgi:hypothetical protein
MTLSGTQKTSGMETNRIIIQQKQNHMNIINPNINKATT